MKVSVSSSPFISAILSSLYLPYSIIVPSHSSVTSLVWVPPQGAVLQEHSSSMSSQTAHGSSQSCQDAPCSSMVCPCAATSLSLHPPTPPGMWTSMGCGWMSAPPWTFTATESQPPSPRSAQVLSGNWSTSFPYFEVCRVVPLTFSHSSFPEAVVQQFLPFFKHVTTELVPM